ncbi:hypothetical protein LTR09_003419 [Extremus antarcticus]|uniref:Uncharacterized protein n=1 Tax=Extremus antarcticus TaxID=702011 RepID=A0AAJ0DRU4_9PEZI|nr:hypothetical protein LTR09_003419 [Extremus antarcticus]
MQRSTLNARALRAAPSANSVSHRQPFSVSSSRFDPLDPSKQGTDVTEGQAKNPEGATPAMQQAKIVKQQGPGQTQQEGREHQKGGGGGKDGEAYQAGLSKKSDPSKKSGEEAVNPAVKQ